MDWVGSCKATDETTRTAGIGRIIFDEIPLEYSQFDLVEIQVIFEPLLLRVDADLISAFTNQSLYLIKAHPILDSALSGC